ncbi:MAG: ABC transporter permease [Lachnospiraceae bacterium]|nr:ABC transporter permease [Lachnospiraceae bacterium]
MINILKATCKLLFRNAGFWLCLICLPILSTYMLGIKQENLSYYYHNNSDMTTLELADADEKVAYYASDLRYVVKVYDPSESKLTDYMLDKLVKTGLFKVGRARTPDMTKADADEKVLSDGQNDRMGAALYISRDFEKHVKEGEYDKALVVYKLSDDERIDLLEQKLLYTMRKINTANAVVNAGSGSGVPAGTQEAVTVPVGTTEEITAPTGTQEAVTAPATDNLLAYLEKADEAAPQKNTVLLAVGNDVNLTKKQIDQKTNMGYAFCFMSLGFVLCGVLLASSVISERNNDVIKRIKLTGTSEIMYFVAKLLSGVIISAMLSGVLAVCTLFLDAGQMGMSRLSLIAMIFLMGLIFCTLSLLAGVLVGNVMGASVASFTIWCLSSMLAGLYFPLTGTSKFVRVISSLMPQKWFVDGTEKIFLGDTDAYIVLLLVTVAYLFVFIGLGSVGLKLRNAED